MSDHDSPITPSPVLRPLPVLQALRTTNSALNLIFNISSAVSNPSVMSRLPGIANPQRKAYASDLSDAEWEILKPLISPPKGFGYPIEVDFREILNGIFYVQCRGANGK